MREILFRGRSMAQGSDWLYGDVLIYENSAQIWETIDGRKHNSVVSIKTVGQFTGVYDKNGKRIFEGDIVAYRGDEYGAIVYDKESARFCVQFDTWSTDFDHLYGKELEVIGNIHDNPELLESEDAE